MQCVWTWDYERSERAQLNQPDPISPNERTMIKEHLLQLMVSQPKLIQAQLGEALSLISAVDFPSRWSGLLPDLVKRMLDPACDAQPDQLRGVLDVMHTIFYRYRTEMKSERLWREIKEVLTAVSEPLTNIMPL